MENFNSGNFVDQGYFKSFQPNFINREWEVFDMSILQLLSKADRNLGRLDMFSEYVPIDLFIQMHIAKEAVESSKIEGTQTKIEETFLTKEEINSEKRNDWLEVQNYIAAMNQAMELLKGLPFSSRLIKKAHHVLLQGVRGEFKMPGEFRRSQNWIGGASINDAIFVPPVHTDIPELMSDLEKFANDDLNPLPDLLKAALIHYQFETIHPFLDGNGRVGRLLITLFLVNKGVLKLPVLYLSNFFEKHRMLYYDNLMRVRTHHDLNQWFKFFLTGIIETSKKGVNTFNGILQLQKQVEAKLKDIGTRSGDALKVVEFLYTKPIVNAQEVSEVTGKTLRPTYNLLNVLEELEIIEEITGAQRGRLFMFRDYMNLFKNENEETFDLKK